MPPPDLDPATLSSVDQAAAALRDARRILVFTGAGISTESGIPDFRGPQGLWKKVDPNRFTIQNYVRDPEVRKDSWRMRSDSPGFTAEPNAGHFAIVELEKLGRVSCLVTQNVDGLHHAAGSNPDLIIEIHGTMREVVCLRCGDRGPMGPVIERVRSGEEDPQCKLCGGMLKSATISFGQNLIEDDLERAYREAEQADAVLAAGSTMSVVPAAYIPMQAVRRGAPMVIVNAEPTEQDELAAVVERGMTGQVLPALVEHLRTS
jgi:NAD-dependent deacetylase